MSATTSKRPTLFFDLDGTLSNNFEGIRNCLNHALETLGYPLLSDAEVVPFVGPPFRESLPRAFPGIDIEQAILHYKDRHHDTGWLENHIYDGVKDTLHALHTAGYPMAVCTAKPRVIAERIIEHFGLNAYFMGVHGPEYDGRFDKKSELLGHLLTQYKVTPNRAYMIGDHDNDMNAAKVNGVYAIGVLWGFGSEAELLAARPSRIITHPKELLDIFSVTSE